MQKRDSFWLGCLLTLIALLLHMKGFPVLMVLYGLATGYSVWLGLNVLSDKACAPAWDRRGIPVEIQRRFFHLQGMLYLANAAVCPLGWLLACFVDFDTDFILLTQIFGFAAISLLAVTAMYWYGKQEKQRTF